MRAPAILIVFALLGLPTPLYGRTAGPVTLTADAIAAGGIKTEPLQRMRRASTVTAFGEVLDPGRLATASAQIEQGNAEIAVAEARLNLARSGGKRAADLFHAQHNISAVDYETAQAKEQVATANVAVARSKLRALLASVRADWGTALAPGIASPNGAVAQLASAAACLVEVTLPFGEALPSAPPTAEARTPTGDELRLQLIGPSPRAPAGGGPAFFYLTSIQTCPAIGVPLQVGLASGPVREGVVVPQSALVWQGATPMVYRTDRTGTFAPVALGMMDRVPGGYFVPANAGTELKPGDSVVVAGAALLLSQSEMPAAAPAAASNDDDD